MCPKLSALLSSTPAEMMRTLTAGCRRWCHIKVSWWWSAPGADGFSALLMDPETGIKPACLNVETSYQSGAVTCCRTPAGRRAASSNSETFLIVFQLKTWKSEEHRRIVFSLQTRRRLSWILINEILSSWSWTEPSSTGLSIYSSDAIKSQTRGYQRWTVEVL